MARVKSAVAGEGIPAEEEAASTPSAAWTKETPRGHAKNATRGDDKRRLMRRSRKHGDACGPWRG